jgi:S1-C subfamily serine protease
VLALVLVFALAGGLGYQAWQLNRLGTQVAEFNRREAAERANDREQLEALAQRAAELERQAGQAFDPEAIAEAVLPSVFRVEAGDSIGTAFAVGSAAADGETNLLTNFHVVEDLWLGGGREVFLERTDQRYAATILEVDAEVDLAWLRTDSSFTGLLPAGEDVRAGQPIVAVGAPLGLTDTVTTGVVSTAERDLLDGSGTHIQFDASVNPGNSGGPVINSAKEVVGITTLKAGDAEGIGFAVPMAVACDTFDVC